MSAKGRSIGSVQPKASYKRVRKRIDPGVLYVPSLLGGLRRSRLFGGVERFCLFVGYARSGGTLVGSLLDAHPDAVISHELDALRYVAAGYRRDQLYWLILRRDVEFTAAGRNWTGYSYRVPGQWQGRFDNLRVIGDKYGGGSTRRLIQNPERLDTLVEVVGGNVALIHVIRNPFDNIARMSLRTRRSLDLASDSYFARCGAVRDIKLRGALEVMDVRHEALIEDPERCLRQLCSNLGLRSSTEYLSACADMVFPSPHRSRHEVSWTREQIRSVEQRMRGFNFLDGYSFTE